MVSVDIFDTLLLRTTMPERVKFEKLGEKKSELLEPNARGKKVNSMYLLLLRSYAARIAYRNRPLMHGAREATLDEIYDVMFSCIAADLGVLPEDANALLRHFRDVELAFEEDDLKVNHQLKEILVNAAANGKKVVAISDMYLSHKDIQTLLVAKGLEGFFDQVYVSSEFGFGKASGRLFDIVLSHYGLLPCQLVHIGDNWHSDYQVPISKGIFASYYPRSFAWRVIRRLRSDISFLRDGSLE